MSGNHDTLKHKLSSRVTEYLDGRGNSEEVRFALSQPIGLLDLPIRLLNLLESNGLVPLKTVDDLLQVSVGKLKAIPQLGDKSVRVIARSLDRFLGDMLLNDHDQLTMNRLGGFADNTRLALIRQHIMGPVAWWNQYRIPR